MHSPHFGSEDSQQVPSDLKIPYRICQVSHCFPLTRGNSGLCVQRGCLFRQPLLPSSSTLLQCCGFAILVVFFTLPFGQSMLLLIFAKALAIILVYTVLSGIPIIGILDDLLQTLSANVRQTPKTRLRFRWILHLQKSALELKHCLK